MKISYRNLAIGFSLILMSCGGTDDKKKDGAVNHSKPTSATKVAAASTRITLDEKGVGQITNITLGAEIDTKLVAEGEALFKSNCTACHKIDKRFIGPSPTGILKRRSPEWIMNMILDPKLMTEQDRCAKDLLIEFNGAAMANQNLTVDETRSILEYFRTL